ncbi:uncharacterized protein BKA78DRAFT_52095 [Phyllosticta capitalensis]|uniref:uncharacterized protein n=1 Tax=Phyllosticta capitalensis TaxID=121624 RepID=UPI0031323DEC
MVNNKAIKEVWWWWWCGKGSRNWGLGSLAFWNTASERLEQPRRTHTHASGPGPGRGRGQNESAAGRGLPEVSGEHGGSILMNILARGLCWFMKKTCCFSPASMRPTCPARRFPNPVISDERFKTTFSTRDHSLPDQSPSPTILLPRLVSRQLSSSLCICATRSSAYRYPLDPVQRPRTDSPIVPIRRQSPNHP